MITVFRKFLNSFIEKPDIWFFYAFLVTNTLSIRKVLFYYPINNTFNEYTGIYLYLSDIFLFLTLTTWILTLYNKKYTLSIYTLLLTFFKKIVPPQYNCSTPVQMFHVEHSTGHAWNILLGTRGAFYWLKIAYQQVIHNFVLIFPLFIAIFSFLSILWADNQQIALFRSIKLFEFILFFFYVYKLFHACPVAEKCSTWNIFLASGVEQFSKNRILLKRVFQIIITISIVQSVIGITQFLIQRSIGLIWLKESIISQDIPGVAKIIFNGHAYIRAYGLFPHPNVFGGFLVFSIIISLLYFKLFHVEQFIKFMQHVKACFREIKIITIVPPARNSTSKNLNQENKASSQNVPRGTFIENFMAGEREIIVISFILLVQTLALLLTFSKSAIIGLFIGLFYLYMIKCSTSIQLFHVEHFKRHAWNILSVFRSKLFYKKIFLISSILIMLFFILKPDTYSLLFKSLQERTFYLNVSHGTFISNPLLGIGLGQFVVNMQNINNIQPWQYQPVHSVFLLILNELGIVIFFMFLYFICKLFHVEQFERKNILFTYFKTILISFLFIMLFDHYFWDIQQGQILLWLLFGIIVGNSRK